MPGRRSPGAVRDRQVEDALLQRALGMTVTEVRREESDRGEKTVTTEKQIAPDITAQVFWLKNRCPDRWRDKPPEPAAAREENNLLELLLQQTEGEPEEMEEKGSKKGKKDTSGPKGAEGPDGPEGPEGTESGETP